MINIIIVAFEYKFLKKLKSNKTITSLKDMLAIITQDPFIKVKLTVINITIKHITFTLPFINLNILAIKLRYRLFLIKQLLQDFKIQLIIPN